MEDTSDIDLEYDDDFYITSEIIARWPKMPCLKKLTFAVSGPIDQSNNCFKALTENCPNITHFKTMAESIPTNDMESIIMGWKNLTKFKLKVYDGDSQKKLFFKMATNCAKLQVIEYEAYDEFWNDNKAWMLHLFKMRPSLRRTVFYETRGSERVWYDRLDSYHAPRLIQNMREDRIRISRLEFHDFCVIS